MNGRHVVLGIGNILNRDEGLGVRALDLLEHSLGSLPGVEYVDGGVMGLSLLPLVEECEHLLVLDAVDGGDDPGALIEMTAAEIRLFTGVKMSEHQITFQEVLGLAFIRDKLPPHLHLIGAQPEDLAIGLGLSQRVLATLPLVVARARAVLAEWGLAALPSDSTARLESAVASSPSPHSAPRREGEGIGRAH
jgi:hydrogenase maturation protease